jgi:hypothetical protein
MPHGLECPQAFVPFGPGSHQAEQTALDFTVVHRQPRFQGLTVNTWSHGGLIVDWQGRKEIRRRPRHLLIWYDFFSGLRVYYTVVMNVWRSYPDSPVFPGAHEVWVLLKGTLLRWKPRNSLTPGYLIFMGHSSAVGVFVCGWVRGRFVNYFLYQCLLSTLFQIMQVSNTSWKSLISGLAQRCYSEDQL